MFWKHCKKWFYAEYKMGTIKKEPVYVNVYHMASKVAFTIWQGAGGTPL
jgi:hypothetical protein